MKLFDRQRNRRIGAEAEASALDHLSRAGLRLVARNYRCRGGEIDLIRIAGSSVKVSAGEIEVD